MHISVCVYCVFFFPKQSGRVGPSSRQKEVEMLSAAVTRSSGTAAPCSCALSGRGAHGPQRSLRRLFPRQKLALKSGATLMLVTQTAPVELCHNATWPGTRAGPHCCHPLAAQALVQVHGLGSAAVGQGGLPSSPSVGATKVLPAGCCPHFWGGMEFKQGI